ncbi:MAG: glycosyltransferase [Flavobacteriales bacterium]
MNQKSSEKWLFFSALPPFRGGIAQFSSATFEALSQKLNIKGYTFRQQYPNFLFPGSSQIDPTAHQTPVFQRVVSTFYPWTYLKALRLFRQEKPDVFVTSYWMSFFAPMMAFWAVFLPKKTKKIALVHNLNPHEKRFFDGFFNRLMIKHYDGFVVLSEAVGKDILAINPTAKIKLIAHPPYEVTHTNLDPASCRQKLGLDPAKKTLLFFGLIRPYKGLLELIQAFSLLDDSYQLLIAGEVYGDATMYHAALAESKNQNWRFFNEFIPNELVSQYFHAADLVVLPYLSATQSGVRALALAQSRAVLCTNVGGLAEGLQAKKEGFELEQTTDQHFANQIKTLFDGGEIAGCNLGLTQKKPDTNQAWLDFASALIEFSSFV